MRRTFLPSLTPTRSPFCSMGYSLVAVRKNSSPSNPNLAITGSCSSSPGGAEWEAFLCSVLIVLVDIHRVYLRFSSILSDILFTSLYHIHAYLKLNPFQCTIK